MEIYNFAFNYLPTFIYFTLLIYLIKHYKWIVVIFFYLIMEQIKNILSNLYVNINAPVFMREVEKYSSNDTSLLMLVVFYIIAFILILLIYKLFFEKKFLFYKKVFLTKTNSVFFQNFFLYLTLIIEFILLLHILAYNTPLFHENINKNNYWTDYALIPQIKFISSQLSLLLFINGFFYAKNILLFDIKSRKNYLYTLTLILAIVYYILMKQKFGGPLLMLFSFYFSYFFIGIFYRKISFSKLILVSLWGVIILSLTVYGYFYMRFGNDAGKMILERIFSLQSEIWEVTYQYFSSNKLPFDSNEFFKELSILFGFNDGYTGMQYVMSKVMEPDYFSFFIDIHINLSSAYPSYLFYLFEEPKLEFILIYFIHVFLYFLYIFLGFKVLEKLLQNKILISGLYLKLFFSMEAIITQVYLDFIFNFKIIIFILLILFIEGGFLKFKSVKVKNEKYSFY